MPLTMNEITAEQASLLSWNLIETELDLLKFAGLKEKESEQLLSGINHPLRRRQKLAARVLLRHIKDDLHLQLDYDENGKPHLINSQGFISISHSGNHISLIYHHDHRTGIDIEIPGNDRILRICKRFMNESEEAWKSAEDPLKDYYLVWGIKECVFKSMGKSGIDFKRNIEVKSPQRKNSSQGNGYVSFKKDNLMEHFSYHFRYLEDYLLVYTIAENNGR